MGKRWLLLGPLNVQTQRNLRQTIPLCGPWGPPAMCQATGPILDPRTVFDSPGHELSKYVAKFYLNVSDDVTGMVKDQIFYCLSSLASAGKVAVSS